MNNYLINQIQLTIGSVTIAGIIAAAPFFSNPPIKLDVESLPRQIDQGNVYYSPALSSVYVENKYYQGTDQVEIAIANFYKTLLISQEPLGAEFEKVLYGNLWELYET